jgi:terminase small subunit-like protein
MGRPSDYTQDLADRICAQLAEGISLRTVCLAEDMPDKSTVFRWLRTNQVFCDQYARAKEEAADALVEDILDIADDGANDWMEQLDKEGKAIGWRENGEAISRSRLRVDTRKWIASKLKAKKYGDKVDMTHEAGDSLQSLLQAIDGKSRSLPARPVE